jgi:hypothetical protein
MATAQQTTMAPPPGPGPTMAPPGGPQEEKSWFNGFTEGVSGLTDSVSGAASSVTGLFGSSTEQQPVQPEQTLTQGTGGRRRSRAKSRQMQMRGGKSNLGLTYYATPVTDANVVQATYKGGSKRRRTKRCKKSHRHKKSCCRRRKSRRHRRH